MIASLAIIILALAWLAYETDRLRVRLLTGPAVLAPHFEAPPPAMLTVKHGVGLWSVARSYAVGWLTVYDGLVYKWNRDQTGGKWYTRTAEVKQYRSTGLRTDARCPKCQNQYSGRFNVLAVGRVSTYTETVGNSTVTFTVCDDCLPKLRAEIEHSQCAKPSKPSPALAPVVPHVEQVRVGSHRDNGGYPRRLGVIVTDFTTKYRDCIPGKAWLRKHAKFQMPDASIEIRFAGEVAGTVEHGARIGTIKALVKAHS